MNTQSLPDFLDYLKSSTDHLDDSLQGVFEHEPLPYDVVYEKFLKIIENFKIKTLTQLKLQLYPSTPNDEQQKDYILLSQMKTLISSKIKMAIDKLNQETDLQIKQVLIDRIAVLNDSLQKVESNLQCISHEFEYTHRGSPTSRSDLSMMFHGLPHHHDDHKDSLDIPHDTVITPVPKFSQYKSDDSALYKMTPLPSESIDNSKHNFKTPTPLSSGLPPRKQFKVNNRITPDSQSHNGDSLSHNLQQFKTDEKSDITDNHVLPNSLGNSGMSLSEMFDACLNSIKRGAPANTQANLMSGAGKKDIFIPPFIQKSPQENTESTKLTEIPETEHEAFETRDSGELPEGARSPGLSAHDEWKNLNIEQEKKMKDFVEKLEGAFEGVLIRKYFKKWRHVPAVFQFQKYQDEDDFDLLHGNFEGMEGADYLDIDNNKFTEDFTLKTGLITPVEMKAHSPIKEFEHDNENLLSERLSFYEESEPEPIVEEQKPQKFERRENKRISEPIVEEQKPEKFERWEKQAIVEEKKPEKFKRWEEEIVVSEPEPVIEEKKPEKFERRENKRISEPIVEERKPEKFKRWDEQEISEPEPVVEKQKSEKFERRENKRASEPIIVEEKKPEKFKRWAEQERSSILDEYLEHKNLTDKENDDTMMNKPKSDKVQSNLAIASPRGGNAGAKKQFGIRFTESSKSKILKDKGVSNSMVKSPPRKENPRKDIAEKPKTGGARSSSIKAAGAGKTPATSSVRTSTSNLKPPSTAVNKENNFVSKASPAKLKRTVSGTSAGKH